MLEWFERFSPLCRAELDSITPRLLEHLWIEVLQSEWQGDLETTPRPNPASPVWLRAATRGTLDRIRPFVDPVILHRLVLRFGFNKLLNHPVVARDAGKLLLEAFRFGRLRAAKELYRIAGNFPLPANVLDVAASSDSTEMIEWLKPIVSRDCTEQAFVNAFVSAFVNAFVNGRVEMLRFLKRRLPDVFASLTTKTIGFSNHIPALVWLKNNRPELLTAKTLELAIDPGSLDAISWIVRVGRIKITLEIYHLVLFKNRPDLLEWMQYMTTFSYSTCIFGVMVNKFAAPSKDRLIEWMQKRYPGFVTQQTLEIAICLKQRRLISFPVSNYRAELLQSTRSASESARIKSPRLLGADFGGDAAEQPDADSGEGPSGAAQQ
ncbi:hypothetical protein HK105_203571 [Polyrhizophydium stewartii]|uniref:Uncharacterized protein n=1 Tax=Polyrhizophydium stewartii TaxID=2732419 RepID=A0ABR4NB86_9FUNG